MTARIVRLLSALGCVIGLLACESCISPPTWKGTIEVAPLSRKEFEACKGDGSPTASGAKVLLRQPYVQNVTPSEATVHWVALPDQPVSLELRPAEGETTPVRLDPTVAGPKPPKVAKGEFPEPRHFRVSKIRATGLEPATLYCYRLVDGAGVPVTDPAPLTTAPASDGDQAVRFIAVGDTGSGSPAQKALARRMLEYHFDFIFFLGDIAYDSGTPTQLERNFFDIYAELFRSVPAYIAIGNHGLRTRNGRPIFDALDLPGNERYYSMRWGPVQIITLDSNSPTLQQRNWLERTLAEATAPWVVVTAHHPMYSNSARGPRWGFRRRFEPLLRRYGVDLFVAGHEHHYERLHPVGGVHHVVSGGGGGKLTRLFGSRATVRQAVLHHFLHFTVTPDKLHMKVVDIDGEVIDELELNKPKG